MNDSFRKIKQVIIIIFIIKLCIIKAYDFQSTRAILPFNRSQSFCQGLRLEN